MAEILTLGEYGDRHPNRPDSIYRRIGAGPDGRESLRHTGVPLHNDADEKRRDIAGKNALLFRKFWYWGRSAVPAAALEYLAHPYIGQTKQQIKPDDLQRLMN
ncbi:MAG: hypothetical protein FJX68_18055 [Alphaproteobacteria bacterium]|nr:hypothetical protein [Alphaproteobacteria bacterium]